MSITVKDLMEYLSTCHPDDLVVLASDEEGNGFSPLAGISRDMYNDREIDEAGTPEAGYVSCVTFWPTY